MPRASTPLARGMTASPAFPWTFVHGNDGDSPCSRRCFYTTQLHRDRPSICSVFSQPPRLCVPAFLQHHPPPKPHRDRLSDSLRSLNLRASACTLLFNTTRHPTLSRRLTQISAFSLSPRLCVTAPLNITHHTTPSRPSIDILRVLFISAPLRARLPITSLPHATPPHWAATSDT
jgi:hypothetical protein